MNDIIYLDNASTTKIDDEVLEAMLPYLKDNYGNAGTIHQMGRQAHKAVEQAREQVANLINAKPEQIIFTSGGTEANNMVFSGTQDYLKKCEKTSVVTSMIEHDSVMHSAENLTKSGFDVQFIAPTSTGRITFENFIRHHTPDPQLGLVSVMHTNNETGTINELEKISWYCKTNDILFHTDCVQAAACRELDVKFLDCDFLSISSHKLHAPKGVGALYARDKTVLSPFVLGGKEQEYGLRSGTENVAGIVGFGKACEILKNKLENGSIQSHMNELTKTLYYKIKHNLSTVNLEHIMHINGEEIESPNRSEKILNLRFDNVDSETLLLMLDSEGICVSSGSACKSHESKPSSVLLAMGITPDDARNSIRLSVSKDNTIQEIIKAARIIAEYVVEIYDNKVF